ncbi:unnamed protein product [Lactuca saligna]|uniref:DNA-directed RNA polymerase n=1 Tax=Lactuca saligna TaxID=75948 RepID=A0AA36EM17_LACSI|nr:unnamed protein product [Lactuca saligna]
MDALLYKLGCWIRDPRSRLEQHPTERGQSLEATGWETKRTLGLFLSSSRPRSRSSTKRGISIMDHKPLTPSSLGLRALGKGSSDGKSATSYKAPIRYREGYSSQEKLLQEAVDALLDNGICGQPMKDDHNRVYKSPSDVIEGKQGRVRETLLGKRVDYSGRSVIVVGPSLSSQQCGLPREIAIELFQAFIIRDLIRKHLASNIGVAKSQIRKKKKKRLYGKYFRKFWMAILYC